MIYTRRMLISKIRSFRFFVYLNQIKERISGDVSPRQTALSVTFGFYLGLFPVVGLTTVLCLVVAFFLRLNHLIIQSINGVLFPFQLILMYPFFKIGEIAFLHENEVFQVVIIKNLFSYQGWGTFLHLWKSIMAAIGIWAIFFIATAFAFYNVILKIIKSL